MLVLPWPLGLSSDGWTRSLSRPQFLPVGRAAPWWSAVLPAGGGVAGCSCALATTLGCWWSMAPLAPLPRLTRCLGGALWAVVWEEVGWLDNGRLAIRPEAHPDAPWALDQRCPSPSSYGGTRPYGA
jgi:hypothetical protein